MTEPNDNAAPAAPNIHKSLVAALRAAQSELESIEKKSKNTHHGYKYASAESVISECRDALNRNGLVPTCTGWETYRAADDPETPRLKVCYRLDHVDSNDARVYTVSTPVVPGSGRPVDKAEAAALTMNLAYWYRGILMVAREDAAVPGVDSRDDTSYQPSAPTVPTLEPGAEKAWLEKISAATSTKDLVAVGGEMKSAKVASVPSLNSAYRDAYARLQTKPAA